MHASLRLYAPFLLFALPLVPAASAAPQAAWTDWTTASPLSYGPGTAGGVVAGVTVTYSGNAAAAGETWHFQCWYRDSVAGATTSNFTDTVAVDLQ